MSARKSSVVLRSNPSASSEFITRQAAATMLSTTVQFIDKLCRNNVIVAHRIGFGSRRAVRIRRAELLTYMESTRPIVREGLPRRQRTSNIPSTKGGVE